MERESNPMEAMCRSGCGFYGNPATDGLCSVCFKEALKKKQQPPQSTPSPVSSASFGSAAASAVASAASAAASPPAASSLPSLASLPPLASLSSPCLPRAAPSSPCPVPVPCADDKSMEEGAGSSGGSSAASVDLDADSDKDASKDKKKKNRCAVCRKKVGLTGFECRCGGLFCSVHRYSDKHECSFDYRELGAQEIRRNNPVVVGEKIHKI